MILSYLRQTMSYSCLAVMGWPTAKGRPTRDAPRLVPTLSKEPEDLQAEKQTTKSIRKQGPDKTGQLAWKVGYCTF